MRSIRMSSLLLLLIAIVAAAAAQTGRLIDGDAAEVGSHPYSASLQRNGAHICGAAIISDGLCLTAAHCVILGGGIESYPARSFLIRAGSIQRVAGGQLVGISSIVVHKEYANGLNDLALLRLLSPLTLNTNTQPIALPSAAPPAGAEIIYSGWGALRTQGVHSHRLQVGSRKTLSSSECQNQLHLQHDGLLCLVSASESSTAKNGMCIGDAGAPAVYNNALVGIGAFYVGGCGTTQPDGFTNVFYYLDWIQANSS